MYTGTKSQPLKAGMVTAANGMLASMCAVFKMYESSASAGKPISGEAGGKTSPPSAATAEKNIEGGTAASTNRFAGNDTSDKLPL